MSKPRKKSGRVTDRPEPRSNLVPLCILGEEGTELRERQVRDVFLRELQLQADIALRSIRELRREVKNAKSGGDVAVWSATYTLLVALSIIGRLLSGQEIRGDAASKRRGKARAAMLRELLGTTDESVLLERAYRNAIEHVDERLDDATGSDEMYVVDYAIYRDAGRLRVRAHGAKAVFVVPLRELDAQQNKLSFKGTDAIDIGLVEGEIAEMARLLRDLLAQPMPPAVRAIRVDAQVVRLPEG